MAREKVTRSAAPRPVILDTPAAQKKPDSGHAGTVSITVRVRRANWNANETPDPVRSNDLLVFPG